MTPTPNQTQPGLLFAYGVTNAGKTYTILGNEAEPGVLPRALSDIFARLERDAALGSAVLASRCVVYGGVVLCVNVVAPPTFTYPHRPPPNTKSNSRCAVVCSYLEVYNDQIFDLLSEEPAGGARRPVNECYYIYLYVYLKMCVDCCVWGSVGRWWRPIELTDRAVIVIHAGAQAGGPRGPHRGEGPLQAPHHGGAARYVCVG